jgi:hypothetical protein
LIDSFWGLALWAGKGAEGAGVQAKPWFYFLKWLLRYEPALLAGGLLGSGLALRRRDPWGSFCAVWFLSQLAIYSIIPYKTPWLALNILLPAALVAGFLVRESWERHSPTARIAVAAVLLLGLGWSGWRAFDVTFRRYDDPRLEIPYVQTRREAMGVVALVRDVASQAPAGRNLTLHALLPYRWPLPWYLRDFPNARYWKGFQDIPVDFDADVLLVDSRQEDRLRPRLKGIYRRRVFPLLPAEQVVVYINELAERGRPAVASTPRTTGLSRRPGEFLRLQPVMEFIDPVVAGGALLVQAEAMAAGTENVDFGFVARRGERVVKLDDGLARLGIVLCPG